MIKISIIVAVTENDVIGRRGGMPWHLRTDLIRFKSLTRGHPVIMGRLTYDSIGKPLPERVNIVVTKNLNICDCRIQIVPNLNLALKLGKDLAYESGKKEIFIIGGGKIYEQTLPLADQIYLTKICAKIDGDTYFPKINSKEWVLKHQENIPKGISDDYLTQFLIYEKENQS